MEFSGRRIFEHDESLEFRESRLEQVNPSDGSPRYYEDTETGVRYPSVSTVLYRTEDNQKRHALKQWRMRVGDEEADRISNRSAVIGTMVHMLIETYVDNGDMDKANTAMLEASPDPEMTEWVIRHFSHVKKVLDDPEILQRVYGTEMRLESAQIRTAGTVDFACVMDNLNSIVDFKTMLRRKQKNWQYDYFLQMGGYSIAFAEMTGIRIDQLVVIGMSEKPHKGEYVHVEKEPVTRWANRFLKRRTEFMKKYGY